MQAFKISTLLKAEVLCQSRENYPSREEKEYILESKKSMV